VSTTTADTRAIAAPEPSARSAYRWLWAAVVFSLLAFGVGAAWDRGWHASHPFEDFWSPPHIFIYTNHLLATLALARIAFAPQLRRHFGAPMQVPVLGEMPPALVLAGGGFAVISLAGGLDSIWHTRFGLDETAWSLPHSMLGSGILLGLLGFASARFALADERPVAAWAPAVFAVVLMGTIVGVLLGPLDNNRSPEQVAAIARIPVLADTPAFQHAARIYATWDLMRTGPLFIPLSAFVVGIALSFAWTLVARWWVFLVVAFAATVLSGERGTAEYLGIASVPRNVAPLPYLVPAVAVLALSAIRLPRPIAWGAAGLGWALACAAVWSGSGPGIVLGMPLMALGAPLGASIARLVRAPDRRVLGLVVVIGLALPVVTGLVDLSLRARTP
jgi:hypothetical protein